MNCRELKWKRRVENAHTGVLGGRSLHRTVGIGTDYILGNDKMRKEVMKKLRIY